VGFIVMIYHIFNHTLIKRASAKGDVFFNEYLNFHEVGKGMYQKNSTTAKK
jgi:hypothetical protein